MEDLDALRATPVVGYRRKSKTYEEDRVCAHSDCTTKLSMYNREDKCAQHAPRRRPRIRAKDKVPPKPKRCGSCAARARSLKLTDLIEEVVMATDEGQMVTHREGFDGAATLCEGSAGSAQKRAS